MTLTNAETEARDRALAYFTSKAVLRPAEVREQIAAAFASLEAVLADVPADRAGVRTLADDW